MIGSVRVSSSRTLPQRSSPFPEWESARGRGRRSRRPSCERACVAWLPEYVQQRAPGKYRPPRNSVDPAVTFAPVVACRDARTPAIGARRTNSPLAAPAPVPLRAALDWAICASAARRPRCRLRLDRASFVHTLLRSRPGVHEALGALAIAYRELAPRPSPRRVPVRAAAVRLAPTAAAAISRAPVPA